MITKLKQKVQEQMITQEELDLMLADAKRIVLENGIDISPFIESSVRIIRQIEGGGYHPIVNGVPSEENKHRIYLSCGELMNSKKSIMSIIIHEVLHCLDPYLRETHHDGRRAEAAEIISKKTEYTIKEKGFPDRQKGDRTRLRFLFADLPMYSDVVWSFRVVS